MAKKTKPKKVQLFDHAKYGITFAELGALLGTRGLLASHVMEHTAHSKAILTRKPHMFNMVVSCSTFECKSVSCIGGTMALIMGMDQYDANDYVGDREPNREYTHANFCRRSDPLCNLFYPVEEYGTKHQDWVDITTKQAIKAIDNFLLGNAAQRKNPWKGVIKLKGH